MATTFTDFSDCHDAVLLALTGRLPRESMCVGEFSKERAGPFGIDDSDKDFRRHNFFGRFIHSTSVPTCPR